MDPSCLPVDPFTACAEHLEADFIPAHGTLEREESMTTAPPPEAEDLDCYSMMEPPPLDWRSDSSSEAGSPEDLVDSTLPQSACSLGIEDLGESGYPPLDIERKVTPFDPQTEFSLGNTAGLVLNVEVKLEEEEGVVEEVQAEDVENQEERTSRETEMKVDKDRTDVPNRRSDDEDHNHIHTLLSHLQLREKEPRTFHQPPMSHHSSLQPEPGACTSLRTREDGAESKGLLFSESHHTDLLGLLQCTEINAESHSVYQSHSGEVDAVVSVSYSQEDAQRFWGLHGSIQHPQHQDDSISPLSDYQTEPLWKKMEEEDEVVSEGKQSSDGHPSYKDVPGPCDPEDLLDGVIFGAKYLGSTQIKSDRNPSTNARMSQAHEAVDRIKAPEGESQPMTEVDLFISTQRIKVLTADTQEAMMDHALQMISYIADIGKIVVLMARRKQKGQDGDSASTGSSVSQKKCTMICHVFSSEDAQIIAQAIGQAFGVAYQQFLQASGIKASDLRPGEYSDYLETQELYNGDLAHFSDSQNLRDVVITKAPGDILGLAVVESGWGSILPTVVVANLLHGGPAERCGELSIGDRIMSVNGTSLVGLPITTCQNIIRDLKSQKYVKLSIVHCPPVTMAIIKRPDPKFQLGFCVEDGIICSLMRGGIAERGGIRVGHRIIEINGQSVVATPHEKIIQTLTNAVGEIHLKTMPASTYRLLTGQEQPVFL